MQWAGIREDPMQAGAHWAFALVLSRFQWPGRGMVRVAPIQQGAVYGEGGVSGQCFKPPPSAAT